ncbi:MAG: type VI secretion system membrane subunit TssM [Pseudomonadota bacterium]
MKKILTHRYFLGALGVLALALLVWFLGDLFAFGRHRPLESRGARLAAALVLLLAWLLWEGARLLLQRRANARLLAQMAGGADAGADQRSREEVALLKGRFEQAAAVLAKLRFQAGGGGQYLYQMPWYMFIGAPGSGKTTALTRSGLRFPLADGDSVEAVKGVGGTRNCDWWFTDEAVFLDTAGRYTTQDSDQRVDAAAWQGFLALLKKARPGCALNGAIITLSLSDLLTQSAEQRVQYAGAVRSRVAELYEALGTRFPLYVVVTKGDLLAGFSEYFADLGHEERAQVWGLTFPHAEAAVAGYDFGAAFTAGFGALEKRLNGALTARMQAERDPQRRAAIFGFPQQFSLAGPLVAHFLAQAFQASRYAQPPLLRGVYFSSGTQEGTPLDRVLGTMARSLGLERKIMAPSAASGKSYFLTRLLRELVFPEAGLVGFDARRERRKRLLLRGGFCALGVAALLLGAGWSVSYARNQAVVAEAGAALGQLKAQAASLGPAVAGADDMAQALALLNAARALPWAYAERKREVPLGLRFGLFQGDKLGEQAVVTYRRLLRDVLLARVTLRLEQQMRDAPDEAMRYEALKTYLMLHDERRLDPEQVEAWIVADWSARVGTLEGRDVGAELAAHLRAAFERRPLELGAPADAALVAQARAALAGGALADRVYNRLKVLGVADGVAPFSLSEAAGPGALQALVRISGKPLSEAFPALYTRDGYKGFKAQADKVGADMAAEEGWVLGGPAGRAKPPAGQLYAEVKQRYLEDYARQWDALLADIRLKPSNSLADTILYARVLGAPDSPLRKLVHAVARETSLGADKSAAAQAEKALTGAATTAGLSMARRVAGSLLGSHAPAINQPVAAAAPELRVEQRFEAIRALSGGGAAGAPVDALVARLNDFYLELTKLESQLRAGTVALQGVASVDLLKAEAAGLPPPLSAVVQQLVSQSSGQVAAAGGKALAAGAQGAAAFCEQAVRGRYPVARGAKAEITPADFGAVFGPGGDLDNYFKANLATQVDMSGPRWRARPGSEGAALIPEQTLHQFQNADTVRKAFFGAGQAGASVDLKLVEGGAATFEYDGESTRLAQGQGALRVKWPAQRPGAQARLSLDAGGAAAVGEGAWALFRLFDKAQEDTSGGADRVRLVFQIDGRKLVLEMHAASVNNPFRLGALRNFQCPGRGTGS